MAHWARIDNTNVVEVTNETPAGIYDPNLKWVEVPDEWSDLVSTQYTYTEGGGFQPPSREGLDEQLLARLASRRWEEQQKKVIYNGNEFSADGSTLAFLRSALDDIDSANAVRLEEKGAGPEPTFRWKTSQGFISLTYSDLQGIIATITTHNNNLFAIEERIGNSIKASIAASDKLRAYNEVDTVTWNIFDGGYDWGALFASTSLPPPPGQTDPEIGKVVEYRIEE